MRTSPGQAEASALGPVQIQKLLGLEPTNSLEGKKAFVETDECLQPGARPLPSAGGRVAPTERPTQNQRYQVAG